MYGEPSHILTKPFSKDAFCILFAGNLGKVQGLETIVSAAKRLKAKTGIKILLLGQGSMKKWLIDQRKMHSLNNLVIMDQVSQEDAEKLYQLADGLLVCLNSNKILNLTHSFKNSVIYGGR